MMSVPNSTQKGCMCVTKEPMKRFQEDPFSVTENKFSDFRTPLLISDTHTPKLSVLPYIAHMVADELQKL